MVRWKKRLLISASIIAGLYVGVSLVNALWFWLSIPAELRDDTWKGTWNSNCYSFTSGRIVAKLPDPIPKGMSFQVDAAVYYNLWCPYRTGHTKRIRLTGLFSRDNSGFGDNAVSPLISKPWNLSFKFKDGSGTYEQIIDYVATTDQSETLIAGGYRSSVPPDLGQFALVRK